MLQDIAERPPQPRRRTPSFYFVLLCLILPVWSAVPLSWLFVFHTLSYGQAWSFTWPGTILFAIALCEVFFSIYHYNLAIRISAPSPVPPGELLEIQAAFRRLLRTGLANLPENGDDRESERLGSPGEKIIQLERDDPRAVDFRNSLRTWFCKAPWSSIKLHQVRQWLYWSIFNAHLPPLEHISHSHRVILDEALNLLEKRSGYQFEEGSNPAVPPILLTLDEVNIIWRPLTFYTTIWSIDFFLRMWYKCQWNVRFGSQDGLEYLIRVPKKWDRAAGPRPIVFLHGLGLGLLQYSLLIKHLLESFPHHPLLVPLPPQISQNIFHPNFLKPLTRRQTTDRLARLLHEFGWVHCTPYAHGDISENSGDEFSVSLPGQKEMGITVISHSNGSYTHAWMLKEYPQIIGRSCFVDPVTFCSWEGDVCYNFIYRPCRTGIELLMRYFVCTELGVANLLQRHFDWASNSLWFEEIPKARDPSKAVFVLGGKDDIVCAERVKRYLTSHGVRKGLWYDPNGRHGQALMTGSAGHLEIIQWLREAES